jgi:hypothetical protein
MTLYFALFYSFLDKNVGIINCNRPQLSTHSTSFDTIIPGGNRDSAVDILATVWTAEESEFEAR